MGSEDSSTTRTGTRLETIDYIFYDEASLLPLRDSRLPLRCTDAQMPNSEEPSDHMPIAISFRRMKAPCWSKVSKVEPDSKGINLMLKCVSCTEVATDGGGSSGIWEAVVGDETGVVALQLRCDEQAKLCSPGVTLRMQNAKVVMVKGYIRIAVDKWAVLRKADDGSFEVNTTKDI